MGFPSNMLCFPVLYVAKIYGAPADFIILAIRTMKVATRKKNVAYAFWPANNRFFSFMDTY